MNPKFLSILHRHAIQLTILTLLALALSPLVSLLVAAPLLSLVVWASSFVSIADDPHDATIDLATRLHNDDLESLAIIVAVHKRQCTHDGRGMTCCLHYDVMVG